MFFFFVASGIHHRLIYYLFIYLLGDCRQSRLLTHYDSYFLRRKALSTLGSWIIEVDNSSCKNPSTVA